VKEQCVFNRVQRAVEVSRYDAIIVVGPDNVQYVTGAALPFLYSSQDQYLVVFWPRNGAPVCICPVEWETTVRSHSWIKEVTTYSGTALSQESAVGTVAHWVRSFVEDGELLGIDADRMPYQFFRMLQRELPDMRFQECDDWLNDLRMTKTAGEQRLLEEIALRTDHGILGAVHHVSVCNSQSEKRLAEEIRVHCMERLLDTVGHHSVSLVASGIHAQKFWPLAPNFGLGWDKLPHEGEFVRLEMRASLDGYWCDAGRMMTMGEPRPAQRRAYEALVTLRETAIRHMRPGMRCSEVYAAVKEEAERQGIELVGNLGIGHGVGVTVHERPHINKCDDTPLGVGMTIVLDPVIYGPNQEIMRSKDMVIITETGCKVVGWYKDWREPYDAARTF